MADELDSAFIQIRRLDDLLLAAVAGQEREVGDWIAQRERAIQLSLQQQPSLADLEELSDRTRRLEDRLLHWRRSAIMELSLIEQHLRYLDEQRPESGHPVPARISLSA